MFTLLGRDGCTAVSFEIAPFGPGSVNNYSVHPKGAFAMLKQCEYCLQPYQTHDKRHRFCGLRCRNDAARRPIEERFWEKVNKEGPVPSHRPELGPCWLWTAPLTQYGYGSFHISHKRRFAHALAYEWLCGPIPASLEPDHLCRNRACVNPLHLEPVTHRENVLRGASFAASYAHRTYCKHGHEYTPENTAMRRDGGGRCCLTCRKRTNLAITHRRIAQRLAAALGSKQWPPEA